MRILPHTRPQFPSPDRPVRPRPTRPRGVVRRPAPSCTVSLLTAYQVYWYLFVVAVVLGRLVLVRAWLRRLSCPVRRTSVSASPGSQCVWYPVGVAHGASRGLRPGLAASASTCPQGESLGSVCVTGCASPACGGSVRRCLAGCLGGYVRCELAPALHPPFWCWLWRVGVVAETPLRSGEAARSHPTDAAPKKLKQYRRPAPTPTPHEVRWRG